MNIELIDDVIKNPYAWPGGYLRIGITSDGGILCPNCIKNNKKLIIDSISSNADDGWRIEAIGILHHTFETEWNMATEEYFPEYCENCGQDINEM